jgi:hypothetical protein
MMGQNRIQNINQLLSQFKTKQRNNNQIQMNQYQTSQNFPLNNKLLVLLR